MSEKKEVNTIGRIFTTSELIRFVAPQVLTRFFLSLLQSLDDSLFLSRYVGPDALAAFGISWPWFMLMDVFSSFILGVNVYCSRLMGEQKSDKARDALTTMTIVAAIIGFGFMLILMFFLDDILIFLGATEKLLPYARKYMSISRYYLPMMFMNNLFSAMYVTAGKPRMSVITTSITTFCNFFFDWLFMVRLNMGIAGTAYANFIGNTTVCIIGFAFYSSGKGELSFTRLDKDLRTLFREVFNNSKSNMLTSMSLSVNGYIINMVMLKLAGEALVSANSIVNGIQFMFMSATFGLISSLTPIVSYAYGEQHREKLSRILKQAILLSGLLSCLIVAIYLLGKDFMMELYLSTHGNQQIREMVDYGLTVAPLVFGIFNYNVLFQDCSIALGQHRLAEFDTFLENVLFSNLTVILIPMWYGVKGFWWTWFAAEALTFVFTVYFFFTDIRKYLTSTPINADKSAIQ